MNDMSHGFMLFVWLLGIFLFGLGFLIFIKQLLK